MAYKALLTSRRGPITPADVGIEGAHRILRVPPVGLQDKCGVPRVSQRSARLSQEDPGARLYLTPAESPEESRQLGGSSLHRPDKLLAEARREDQLPGTHFGLSLGHGPGSWI